jgi:hypothetical protein
MPSKLRGKTGYLKILGEKRPGQGTTNMMEAIEASAEF